MLENAAIHFLTIIFEINYVRNPLSHTGAVR